MSHARKAAPGDSGSRCRVDRVRYDTPVVAGFQLSSSWTDDNEWDVALRFSRSFDGHRFTAAVACVDGERGKGFDQDHRVHGSASLLFSNGFNLTFAAGMDEYRDKNRGVHFVYGKAGRRC